jgi:hypothetical protein
MDTTASAYLKTLPVAEPSQVEQDARRFVFFANVLLNVASGKPTTEREAMAYAILEGVAPPKDIEDMRCRFDLAMNVFFNPVSEAQNGQ